MLVAGLEPALCRHKQILSLPRLPFRHTSLLLLQPNIMLSYPAVLDKHFLEINSVINFIAVKGCKIIPWRLRSPDKRHAAVLLQKKLC